MYDDPDGHDLADQLSTRIGMIMEDTSVVAPTLAPHADPVRSEAIDDLEHAAKKIRAGWGDPGARRVPPHRRRRASATAIV